jgi:hypothetical protein
MEKITVNLKGEATASVDQLISTWDNTFLYRLTWTDNVANTWEEYYPTLPIALARLSALAECVDFPDKSFQTDSAIFTVFANQFLEQQVA